MTLSCLAKTQVVAVITAVPPRIPGLFLFLEPLWLIWNHDQFCLKQNDVCYFQVEHLIINGKPPRALSSAAYFCLTSFSSWSAFHLILFLWPLTFKDIYHTLKMLLERRASILFVSRVMSLAF